MNKINQILALALAGQIALAAWLLQDEPVAPTGRTLVFPGFSADAATKIEVSGPELGSGDNSIKTVHLVKQGKQWGLGEVDDYPVRNETVSELLGIIRKLTTGPKVTSRSVHHAKLKVAEDSFERRIVIKYTAEEAGQKSERTIDFYIGTKPHRDRTHFRQASSDDVYVVPEIDSWDIGITDGFWVEKEYVSVPDEELRAVKIRNKNGEFVLERDAEQKWSVAGWDASKPLNRVDVAAMAKRASSVELAQPLSKAVKKGYGLNTPVARVTLFSSSSTAAPPNQWAQVNYSIGGPSIDEHYYVKSDRSAYVAKVRPIEVNAMVDLSLTALEEKKE